MLSVISQSVRDAHAQLHTGHQDIRTYFSQATTTTTAHTTTIPTFTGPGRPNVLLLDVRQRFQSARGKPRFRQTFADPIGGTTTITSL
jgi:hypothetical protein